MTHRLEVEGLRCGYGDVTIIPMFDVSCEAGTVVAILGPNGAGKTTLLMTMAGLLQAQDGAIRVDGDELRNGQAADASRKGVVLVPDDRALFTTLTVDENLKAAKGRHDTTIESAYDLFPALASRRKVTAGNLSGGEQQMLAVARALMQDPRVLLIDEMSMGLAPIIVEQLLPLVRTIADERNAVVVLVEQHVRLALEVADRAIAVAHGDVVLDRSAAELRDDTDVLERAYFGQVSG